MLPPGQSWHNDPKDRIHLVAAPPSANGGAGSAFYCSSSGAQEVNGTPCALARPRTKGSYRNTLSGESRIYPGIVRPVLASELGDYAGRVIPAELDAALRHVPAAFGFGQGNCFTVAVGGSLRGYVVALDSATAERAGTPFGVVLTPHVYSTNPDGFLTLVPLALDTEPDFSGGDLLLEDGSISFEGLLPALPVDVAERTSTDSAVIIACEPFAIEHGQLLWRSPLVMPGGVLAEVERRLGGYFGLESVAVAASS